MGLASNYSADHEECKNIFPAHWSFLSSIYNVIFQS